MNKVYVLYHANCNDGTGAKYAAWKKYKQDAQYIPVQYGKPFPKEVSLSTDSEVFILDFSYSKDLLEKINSKVGFLKVIDHHKTAREELSGLPYAEFNMEKSGAVMAWEYFHPGVEVPTLLLHIQDGDLWTFSMKDTDAIRAAISLVEGDMLAWDSLANESYVMESLISAGRTIMHSNSIKINSVIRNNVKVLPYRGLKAGVCNTTTLVSEIGNMIYDNPNLGCDFSLTYFMDKEGTPIVSFRSKTGTDIDVSAFAKELGGGGHKHASGSKVTLSFIEKLYKGEL